MTTLLASLRIALRALTVNKMRSALTMLGIIIGVGAVIAMIAVGSGAKRRIADQIASMGSNMLIVMSGTSTSGGFRGGMGTVPTLKAEDAKAILAEIPSFNYAYDKSAKGLLLNSSVEDGPAEIRLLEESQASKDGVSASGGLSKWERFQNRFQRSPRPTYLLCPQLDSTTPHLP